MAFFLEPLLVILVMKKLLIKSLSFSDSLLDIDKMSGLFLVVYEHACSQPLKLNVTKVDDKMNIKPVTGY